MQRPEVPKERANGDDERQTGRAKISQVFQFLRALNEHRNPACRELAGQLWSLRLRDLPAHPAVWLAPIGDAEEPEQDTGDILLRAERPTQTPAPDPPVLIREWLMPSWTDARKSLEHRPTRNETQASGQSRVVGFDEDPRRVAAMEDWRPVRDDWARNELPTLNALSLFEQLYDLHGRIEREAERVELVLGDGVLSWKRAEGSIFHPILLQRVQLRFEPSVPCFTISDIQSPPELYTGLLRGLGDIDGRILATCRSELNDGGYVPLGGSDTDGFLERLGNCLSAATVYHSDRPPASAADPVQIGRDPVLFLRRRNLGFSTALENILADLPGREDLPTSLLRLVGTDVEPTSNDAAPAASELWSEPDNVLLSKPANPEQVQIAERLDRYGCVLVQGPPGTGKTHTIANLIGHLLAQGKSVLVTSHTTKALKVLRSQVVDELRPLCVSVLDDDLQSRSQLELAVTAIADRLSSSDAEHLDLKATQLEARRKTMLEELQRARKLLLAARSDEYRDVVLGGRSWAPSRAARQVAAERDENSWIPGLIEAGALCPLTDEEVSELYASNALITAAQEAELGCSLPEPGEIPSPMSIAEYVEGLESLDGMELHTRADLWIDGHCEDDQKLLSLADRCLTAVEPLGSRTPWKLEVIRSGMSGEDEAATWRTLLEMIQNVSATASASRELLLRHGPEVGVEGDTVALCNVAREVRIHLEAGGSLGTVSLLFRPAWKALLRGSRVAVGEPKTAEHLEAIEAHLRLNMLRAELCARWDRQLGVHGAPRSDELGNQPEHAAAQFCPDIDRLVGWAQEVWNPLQAELEHHGIRWQSLLDEQPPNLAPNGALLRLQSAVVGPLQAVLRARARLLQKRRFELLLSTATGVLTRWASKSAQSPCVDALLDALRARDAGSYTVAFAELVELLDKRKYVERRQLLLEKLEPLARSWAAHIKERRGIHGSDNPPGSAKRAWIWRQLHDELVRRAGADLSALQREIETRSAEVRRLTAELIESRAWAGQVRRTALPQRQALEGWLQTVRKIGRGTGKRVPRLRVEAARKMSECKNAVPVWVMPLSQAVESFDAKTRFDCVIIDEASQSDPLALVAMYMGRDVVVVGDHEQVSPSAVGQQLDVVQQLIDEHLRGIPNCHLYDGQTSVYDLAKSSFGGMVCLTEHFRCVPEIIEFSNQLSYGGRIKALRDSGSSTLNPALVLHRVEGTASDKMNIVEAREVAALLAAAIEHPGYYGKTFGVISLVGDDQALAIERLLREHVSPFDLERCRVLCGNAAQFQGDERDVMFLSMVDSPRGGPLRLRTENMYKQRFNVAASRAKDQLWVIHSLNVESDLKPDDLRRKLIEHCRDPFSIRGSIQSAAVTTESQFELEVLERLVRAGYRVTPQWQVGHYRIDLVVENEGRKLAVECDGDRYHSVENLQEDLGRQAILERLGWQFARIRGSAFFRDPEAAMGPVYERLRELRIHPEGARDLPGVSAGGVLLDEVIRRASEFERDWRVKETAISSEPDEVSLVDRKEPASGLGELATSTGRPTALEVPSAPSKPLKEQSVSDRGTRGAASASETKSSVSAQANALPTRLVAGQSRELIRSAIMKALDPSALTCGRCGASLELRADKKGPYLKCRQAACTTREVVEISILGAALRDIAATCDCGAPLRVVRFADGTFIGCAEYPRHRKSMAWKDL